MSSLIPTSPVQGRPSSRSKAGARRAARWTVIPAALVLLAACGSSSSSGTSATAGASGGPGGMDMTAITTCLKNAGIDTSSLTAGGGGTGTGRPTGQPTGQPSGGAKPSGNPSGGAGGGGGMGILTSAKAQAALKKCGITVPTGGAGGQGGPQATATSGS